MKTILQGTAMGLIFLIFFALPSTWAGENPCPDLIKRGQSTNLFEPIEAPIWERFPLIKRAENLVGRLRNRTKERNVEQEENFIAFSLGGELFKKLADRFGIDAADQITTDIYEQVTERLEQNPEWGHSTSYNYKSQFFSSTLSSKEFSEKIVDPIVDELKTKLRKIGKLYIDDEKQRLDWENGLVSQLQSFVRVGEGQSIEEAHFQSSGIGMRYEDWKQRLKTFRQKISSFIAKAKLSDQIGNNNPLHDGVLEKLLEKRYSEEKKAPGSFLSWLSAQGVNRTTAERLDRLLSKYQQFLQLVDFIPIDTKKYHQNEVLALENALNDLKNNRVASDHSHQVLAKFSHGDYHLQRARFFNQWSEKTTLVIATDFKNFGAKSLLARDQWIQSGDSNHDLNEIYRDTTQYLDRRQDEFKKSLQEIIGNKNAVDLYYVGDDGVIAVSGSLSDSQKSEILAFFSSQPDLYFGIVSLKDAQEPDKASVAQAILKAREVVSKKKDAEKSEILDL